MVAIGFEDRRRTGECGKLTDNEVEPAHNSRPQRDARVVGTLNDVGDGVTENDLHIAIDRVVKQRGQIAARQAGKPFAEGVGAGLPP